jgi:DNA-binding PadR family transcriptional regulator
MSLQITLLGYALLGLIRQNDCSGYDLRKTFAETPMGTLGDSPGAIYPALRRLEERGLIRSRPVKGSVRQRRELAITNAGVKCLTAWLTAKVQVTDVMSGMKDLMLRFAFLDAALGEAATLRFLRSMEAALKEYVPELRSYFQSNAAHMTSSARLALESGILSYEAQSRWVKRAIEVYEGKVEGR